MKDDLIKYLKENFSKEDAKSYYSCYNKIDYIYKLLRYARKKSDGKCEYPCGDFDSKHMILLDTMENKEFISFFRMIVGNISKNYYDYYLTSINKTTNTKINEEVIQREIEAIKPLHIYTYQSFNPLISKYNIDKNIIIHYINDDEFSNMINLMNHEQELSETDKKKLEVLKYSVWGSLKTICK